MCKKPFIVGASVIAIAVLSMVLFKPTDVEAHDNGCGIVSPSTMVYCFFNFYCSFEDCKIIWF